MFSSSPRDFRHTKRRFCRVQRGVCPFAQKLLYHSCYVSTEEGNISYLIVENCIQRYRIISQNKVLVKPIKRFWIKKETSCCQYTNVSSLQCLELSNNQAFPRGPVLHLLKSMAKLPMILGEQNPVTNLQAASSVRVIVITQMAI